MRIGDEAVNYYLLFVIVANGSSRKNSVVEKYKLHIIITYLHTMRKFITFIFLGLVFNGMAQNVGVGITTPTEKLHVAGNINLAGNLKLNGVTGQSGQVLMTNSSGNTQWTDMTTYENYVNFNGISGNWTVPAGVTKIKVQAWGGGGGGCKDAGGGSGGYITATITVAPGDVLTYTNGGSGAGSTTSGATGGTTSFTVGGIIFYAYGGGGAVASGVNVDYGSGGDFVLSNSTFRSWFGVNGSAGSLNRLEYFQRSATEFLKSTSGGDGGNSPYVANTGGKGRTMVINAATLAYVLVSKTTNGLQPGGGGGGGFDNGSIGVGGNGGFGMTVIQY